MIDQLLTHLLNLVAMLACAAILWRAEPALARMTRDTHWMMRYALLLLAGGALGTLLGIVGGLRIDFQTALLLAGIALMLMCERRLGHFVNLRRRNRHA